MGIPPVAHIAKAFSIIEKAKRKGVIIFFSTEGKMFTTFTFLVTFSHLNEPKARDYFRMA